MKKMKTMMLMLLVACMGFAVQSCGSDDDKDKGTVYTLNSTVDVKAKGTLTDAEILEIKDAFTKSVTGEYISDAAAATAAAAIVDRFYSMLQAQFANYDWSHEDCNIVFSIVTTNNSSKKVVSSWTITVYKGITKQQLLL